MLFLYFIHYLIINLIHIYLNSNFIFMIRFMILFSMYFSSMCQIYNESYLHSHENTQQANH
jgi:hypothetical protein